MFRMGSDSQKDIDRDQKMYRCIDGGMWNVEWEVERWWQASQTTGSL